MFALFNKRPGLTLGALLGMVGVGVLLAHQQDTPAKVAVLSSVARRVTRPASQPWMQRLNLAHARPDGDALIQQLEDGTRVTYTINAGLQRRTHAYLRAHEVPYGAAVMYRVTTGEVLVLAGHSERATIDAQTLCLTPWAPAASVFKLVSVGALLGLGVPDSTTICHRRGLRGLNESHLRDDPRADRLCHSLSDAVARSINPVIGKLAARHLDTQSLGRWSERFGFNRPIPFELPVSPSRAAIPEDRLELARTAAGFWHTEISPLHGAVIAAVVGSGGMLHWPHVVRRVLLANGRRVQPPRPDAQRVLGEDAAAALAQMMARTVTEGTGRRGFRTRRGLPSLRGLTVAGKTGSLSRSDPYLSYSWFVGFAPVDNPEVAFAVLLGNPPRWRVKASTVARMLLHYYLDIRPNPDTKAL